MDQGRRLVGAALVHRPDPLQLQVMDIAGVDLLEGAVAPVGIVAAPDQPVAFRRIGEHGVRHRLVILDVAHDRLAKAADHAGAVIGVGRRTAEIRIAAGSGTRRRRLDALLDVGRHGAGRDGGDPHRRRRRKFGRAGLGAVGLQDEGDQAGIGFGIQAARLAVGHRGADGVVKIGGGALAPGRDERLAGQRQRIAFAREIGLVAAHAVCRIGGAPGLGLGRGERRRRLGQAHASEQSGARRHKRHNRYGRLPKNSHDSPRAVVRIRT